MAELVYILCSTLSIICALALFRAHRAAGSYLLLWTCIAFGFLALNNLVLLIDMLILPEQDFGGALLRNICGTMAGFSMIFGLIWEVT